MMMFLEMILFFSQKTVSFITQKTLSTYTLKNDTFKITKLLPVSESGLMFAISEEFGAYIFNMTSIALNEYNDPKYYVVGSISIIDHVEFME